MSCLHIDSAESIEVFEILNTPMRNEFTKEYVALGHELAKILKVLKLDLHMELIDSMRPHIQDFFYFQFIFIS